jgi:type IV pilus assembly protein PilW
MITRYLRADQMVVAGSTAATQNNWRRVRAIRIGMIMRGPAGSAIDRATQTLYPLGIKLFSAADSFSEFVAPADGRLRQEVTFTVHMRNYLGQGV